MGFKYQAWLSRTNTLAYFGAAHMTEKKNYYIGTWLRQNLVLRVFILIFDRLRILWCCNRDLRTNVLAYFGAVYMIEKKNNDISTCLRQNLVFRVFILIFHRLSNLWCCNSLLRTNTLAYFVAAHMTMKKNYDIGTLLRQNLF